MSHGRGFQRNECTSSGLISLFLPLFFGRSVPTVYIRGMNNDLQIRTEETVLSPEYPFMEDVSHMLLSKRVKTRTSRVKEGIIRQKMTVTLEQEYVPMGYARLYQKKDVLQTLSPAACKIMVYLSYTLHFDHQKVKISVSDVGMERRRFSKAIQELIEARIIAKEKRQHYWVNVSIIIVGTTPKLPSGYDRLSE